MQEKFGVTGIEKDGIFFTEKNIPRVIENLGSIKVRMSGQNKGPGAVKRKLARIARAKGANAVMDYTCDQRSHKWWEQVFTFRWDSESWHGRGIAVRATE